MPKKADSVEDTSIRNNILDRCGRMLHAIISAAFHVFTEVWTVLKWPVLFVAAAFEFGWLLPVPIYMIPAYGLWAVALLLLTQTPFIFLAVREVHRRTSMQPKSEEWETPTAKWNRTISEYVKDISEDDSAAA